MASGHSNSTCMCSDSLGTASRLASPKMWTAASGSTPLLAPQGRLSDTPSSLARGINVDRRSRSGMYRRMFANYSHTILSQRGHHPGTNPGFSCPTRLCVAAECRLHMPRIVQQRLPDLAGWSPRFELIVEARPRNFHEVLRYPHHVGS